MDVEQTFIDYAAKYLRVKARPNEAIAVTLEQVVGFAKQLRDGCEQDLKRLIVKCADDPLTQQVSGREALLDLGYGIEGNGVDSWGLPDCACKQSDCVYCSRGFAIAPEQPPQATETAG